MYEKILQLSALMTMLVMASPSLFSACDMKMEPMDAPCNLLASLAGDRAVAYLEDAVQESLLKLHELYPNWGSELFKQLCKDLKSKANVLLHEQAVQVVDECAAFCDQELKKNIVYKQALEVIQEDLQDYQQFLASAESRLKPQDEMMTKRRCCAPAVNCFNIAPYIPFLPTGPVAPGNYFYAYRQTTTVDYVFSTTYTPIPFTAALVSDGNWTFDGTAGFIAQNSGVYFITATFPILQAENGGPTPSRYIQLQPTLAPDTVSADVAIPFTGVFYWVDFSVGNAESLTVQLSATFVANVSAGQVLRFQGLVSAIGNAPRIWDTSGLGATQPINGSVSIVRLR